MSVPAEKMPIYDDRVNLIIRSLGDGVPREELASQLRYRDYKGLDMYMRRRNFTWDSKEKNYKPISNRISEKKLNLEDTHTGKVSRIICAFEEGKDPKTIAQEYGFTNHRNLADYMSSKGYEWNGEKGTYIRKAGIENKSKVDTSGSELNKSGQKKDDELLHLVKSLYEKLYLAEDPIVDTIPRYLVSGIAKTKSVQLSHLLHQLLEDFSFEKNITQRQILETALIDFFRRYGYKHEVDTLLRG